MRKYFLSFIVALALHLGIIGLFAINISTDKLVVNKPKKVPEIIEATILDETVVEAKAKELHQQEVNTKRAQQQQKDDVARQLKLEKKRLQEAKNRRLQEEKQARKQAENRKKLAVEEQKKLLAIQQKVALEKKKQQKQEKQRLAEQKKQALEKKRKAEVERVAEEKRKVEVAKKEAARVEAEKQEKIAAEKKQRENEEKLKIATAKQAEENRIRSENAKIAKQAAVSAVALIKRKVTQNWNQPSAVPDKLSCKIKVSLIPSGDVMSVSVVKSSGDPLFDDSVERAVYKASPLPVPKDPNVFKQFRNFTFVFAPN